MGSGPQLGRFRTRLLSQQGQGQSEPWCGCQGEAGNGDLGGEAWSCPQVNRVGIGQRESLMDIDPDL